MSCILIVDDEPQILRMLRASLTSSGYEVISATNGIEGYDAFVRSSPDLVITDMTMPKMDGFAMTEEIRRLSKVPIIILSVRDGAPVKVGALDTGADDYVTKPFSMPELLARVRVQLRRAASEAEPVEPRIEDGDFQIDTLDHSVQVRSHSVHLTPKEFDLLVCFARHPRRVLTHKMLLKEVWGDTGANQTEYLRVLIARLRKKLDPASGERYIQGEPWVGYRFTPEGQSKDGTFTTLS